MSKTDKMVRLVKGFILNKMILSGFIGGKHTDIRNVPKSCPSELRPYVDEALGKLQTEGFVRRGPKGYGKHVSAVANQSSYQIANDYRKYARLEPPLVYGTPSPIKSKPPLSIDELRRLRFGKEKQG